jgi:hypothetical protein
MELTCAVAARMPPSSSTASASAVRVGANSPSSSARCSTASDCDGCAQLHTVQTTVS